jgi:hypothetical protein
MCAAIIITSVLSQLKKFSGSEVRILAEPSCVGLEEITLPGSRCVRDVMCQSRNWVMFFVRRVLMATFLCQTFSLLFTPCSPCYKLTSNNESSSKNLYITNKMQFNIVLIL